MKLSCLRGWRARFLKSNIHGFITIQVGNYSYNRGENMRGSSRGAYYKAKYGGRGRGNNPNLNSFQGETSNVSVPNHANTFQNQIQSHNKYRVQNYSARGNSSDLVRELHRIDGKNYGSYKDIEGIWSFENFNLIVDKVQADPFAPASCFRAQTPCTFPSELLSSKIRRIALCDYVTRVFDENVKRRKVDMKHGDSWHSGKGGDIFIDAPSQIVLERTAVIINDDVIEARFTVNLPAQGRTILSKWCIQILTVHLPVIIQLSLFSRSLDHASLFRHVSVVEDADWLRCQLSNANLAAFIADGSQLPRKSGASDEPMDASDTIAFESPPSLRVDFDLPNYGKLTGMGIRKGLTLIVGGGFHGKSTLLHAIENGVYNHIPGDGREYVVSDFGSVKVRAEDGRGVAGVNISPFISHLPSKKKEKEKEKEKETSSFSSSCASGSTSQAANIMEMMEMGCNTLLLDEDTCALNFMIRDERMKALVSADKEPITPFISRVRDLILSFSASVILVIGGCGDFFSVADTVIMMDAYVSKDVTTKAKEIHGKFLAMEESIHGVKKEDRAMNVVAFSDDLFTRVIDDVYWENGSQLLRSNDVKVITRSKPIITFGEEEIDLSVVEQIVEKSQTRSIASAISLIREKCIYGRHTVYEIVNQVDGLIDSKGLDILSRGILMGNFSRPRKYEIAAALNRLRTLKIKK